MPVASVCGELAVSNPEDPPPDFDDLDLPSDDSLSPEYGSVTPESEGETLESEAAAPSDETAESGGLDDLAVGAPVLAEGEPEEVAEEEPEEEEPEKGPGLLAKLATSSPYVVMLGISLAAILIAILCLFLELGTYDYEIKPKEAGIAPAVQSGGPSTTATA